MQGRSPFMQQVRNEIRVQQKALTTEKTYCYWISFFIRFSRFRSPNEITCEAVTPFLTYLAVYSYPQLLNQACTSTP